MALGKLKVMPSSAANVLDLILQSWAEGLTRESADQVLRFRLDESTQRRIEELADKAAEGELSEPELNEYSEYVEAIDLLGILKGKAREALARRAGP
jgi:hypothetical protein